MENRDIDNKVFEKRNYWLWLAHLGPPKTLAYGWVSARSKTCRYKSDMINDFILLLSYISFIAGKTRRCLRNRIRLTKLPFMPSVSQRFHLVITTPSLNPSTVMYNNNQSVLQFLLSMSRCLRWESNVLSIADILQTDPDVPKSNSSGMCRCWPQTSPLALQLRKLGTVTRLSEREWKHMLSHEAHIYSRPCSHRWANVIWMRRKGY